MIRRPEISACHRKQHCFHFIARLILMSANQLNVFAHEKIRGSRCKCAVSEKKTMPCICPGFDWVWPESFSRTMTMCISHSKELWSLNGALSTISKLMSPKTPSTLNIQERTKYLMGQNIHHGFHKMPQVRSDATAAQLSCRSKFWHVVFWSPSLCFVLCSLTAAAEFSLKEVNTAEGWHRCSAQKQWLQFGQQNIF